MKNMHVIIAATLVLPLTLAAQQPAPPQQPPVNPITAALKASGGNYGRWIMQAFDSIPESKFSFKPTPIQMSFGLVAAHLESANYNLCSVFGGMPRTMTARDSMADSVRATWPKDSLNARLKASFAFCDKAIATVDDGKLAEQITLPTPPNAPAGAPPRIVIRARYVLGFVTDLVDHYSQIANYMRLNAMIPPSAIRAPGRGGN